MTPRHGFRIICSMRSFSISIVPFGLCWGLLLSALADDSLELRRAARRAVADNNSTLFAALLQAGLGINQSIADTPDEEHDPQLSALMFAVAWNKPEMLRWLQDAGASGHYADANDLRPIDLALQLKRNDLAEMLRVPSKEETKKSKIPRDAVNLLADVFDLPEPLFLFVRLNGADPDDDFTQAIARDRKRTLPASMAKSYENRIATTGDTRFWFSHRISGDHGARLSVIAKQVADTQAWDVTCKLEGRPTTVKSAVDYTPMPVEKVTGRLLQQYGWWVLENRQPALGNPIPAPPAASGRHADLAPLAEDTCWEGNVFLISALIDAGLDGTTLLDADEPYSNTLLEQAAWSSNPRFLHAVLAKVPSLRARPDLLRKAAALAFAQGNEAALTVLERRVSGTKVGGYPIELIDDLVSGYSNDPKDLYFISLNDTDPDKAIMERLKKIWPTAVPFSEAITGEFTQGKGEASSSSFGHRTSKLPGTKIELELKAETDGSYRFQHRHTRGVMAGGGTRGRLVFSHGYWFATDTQGWDE